MTITLRGNKSTALTFAEMDGNFTDLDGRTTTIEGAYISSINGLSATSNAVTITTANITENTNLYYTDTRSRAAISVTDAGGDGSLAYNSSTGVITYTGPSAAEVRAHFSAGDGITLAAGAISIGNDAIKDTMIDFGTGANQVSTADVPEQTNLYYTDGRADARIAAASIDDLSDVTLGSSQVDGHGLVWNAGANRIELAELPGAAGGEANTGANVGGYNQIFQGKAGVQFNFRTINHGTNLTITQNTDDLLIALVDSPEFGNIKINSAANTIENTATNSNIVLKPNGTGAVDVDTSKIINVTDPTNAQDAATKAYVDAAVTAEDLDFAGDTGTGAVDLDSQSLTIAGTANEIETSAASQTITIGLPSTVNIATQANIADVSISGNKVAASATNADLTLAASGTGTLDARAQLNMNSNKVVSVADPTSAQDAATKAYVDSALSSGTTIFTLQADSGSNDAVATGDTIDFEGTTNEIETAVSDSKITIGLPSNVTITNDLTVGNQMTVTGNLTVNGTTTTVSSSDIAITDGKLQLADGNESSDTLDIGFVGHYYNGVRRGHAGLIRDASDKKFKLFSDYGPEPDQPTIDTDDEHFRLGTLVAEALELGDTDSPSMHIRGSRLETVNTNQNIEIETAGTGIVDIGANVRLKAQADLRFADSDSSNYVALQAPATVSSDLTFTLPATDGSSGQALVTNGSGVFSFAAAGATISEDATSNTDFNLYFASTTSGALTAVKYDTAINYNPSTETLSVTNLSGTASLATEVTITANNTANETVYLTFVDGATGSQGLETDTGLSYNPSTNVLSTTASQAQYADLAEVYNTDRLYAPGTVVMVGGDAEVTAANNQAQYIAGVVSTDPAYLMNSGADGQAIALVGRVPVRVLGSVTKGQPVFAANGGLASTTANGPLVGLALETNSDSSEKSVECLLKV